MFEKILAIIDGATCLDDVQPRIIDAGFVVTHDSLSVLEILDGDTRCSVIQLWGNKVILRGVDSKGFQNEVVTYNGLFVF